MQTFTDDITNRLGTIAGRFTGSVCNSIEEVFQSMGFITEDGFMQKWERRIPGGFRFSCSVLSRIDVWEEFENHGLGTRGMQQFNQKSISLGAVMGIVRIGWQGDPVAEKMAKNLHFYEKTGWTMIHREDDFEHYLAYRLY